MDENTLAQKMQDIFSLVVNDIGTIRTGRATPSLVENIVVSVYGGTQKLKIVELATISVSDARTLVLEPWDKSIIGEIRQGILTANVGLNPAISENVIRITLPPMTTEDRENYVKLLSTKAENGRIMIRQARGDAMRDVRSAFDSKQISEDEKFAQEKKIQEITDEFTGKINAATEAKKKEILEGV